MREKTVRGGDKEAADNMYSIRLAKLLSISIHAHHPNTQRISLLESFHLEVIKAEILYLYFP